MANIPVGGQLVLNKSLANIDARFGPYSSIQSAYNAIVDTCDEIISGLHFGIVQNDGSVKEYVWTLTGGTTSDYREIDAGEGGSVTVVDSLNSTSSTAALSAKQGKVLSEQLATKLSSPIQISDVAGLQNALNNAGGSGEGGTSITVVDNLTSDSTTSALSAKQGNVLAGMIEDAQDSIEEVQESIAVTKDGHNNIKDSISTIEYAAGSSNVALAGGKVSTRSGSIAIGSLAKTNVTTNPSWGSPYMANATAIGYSAEANGYFSTAVGIEAIASNVYSTAYGVLNKPTTNSIVTIGCGYRNTDSNGTLIKINAFETDNSQKVYIRGIGGYTGEETTDEDKAGKDVETAYNNIVNNMVTSSNLASKMSNLGFVKTNAGSVAVKTGGTVSSTMTGSTVVGNPYQISGNNVTYVGRGSTISASNVTVIGNLTDEVKDDNKFNTIIGASGGFATNWKSSTDTNLTGVFTLGDSGTTNNSIIAIVKDSTPNADPYKYYFRGLGWDGTSAITSTGQKDLKTYIKDLVDAAVAEALSAQ